MEIDGVVVAQKRSNADEIISYATINNVNDIHDTLIGSLIRSNADVVIFMPQDILRFDKNSRINTPGKASGNWKFRFRKDDFSKKLAIHLSQMVEEANR